MCVCFLKKKSKFLNLLILVVSCSKNEKFLQNYLHCISVQPSGLVFLSDSYCLL